MSSADHDYHRRLVREVVLLRRELLGVEAVAVPHGNADVPAIRHKAYEAMLAMPDGFLKVVRDPRGPFAHQDAYDVLDHLEESCPLPWETVPVCQVCAEGAALVIRAMDLPFRVADAPDKFCLCRSESCDETDMMLRLAVEVSGRPRLLVVGGNPYIDRAAGRMRKPDVLVARDHFRVDPRVIGRVDGVVWALGMLGHKHAAPIERAFDALPERDRPLEIGCRRPNANTVALSIIARRHDLLARTA